MYRKTDLDLYSTVTYNSKFSQHAQNLKTQNKKPKNPANQQTKTFREVMNIHHHCLLETLALIIGVLGMCSHRHTG